MVLSSAVGLCGCTGWGVTGEVGVMPAQSPSHSCAEQLGVAVRCLSGGDGPGAGMGAGQAAMVWPTSTAHSKALRELARGSPQHLITHNKLSSLSVSQSLFSCALQSKAVQGLHVFMVHHV